MEDNRERITSYMGGKMKDLSVVIVSYNTRDLTIGAIESVIKTAGKLSYEIIVVDNDSKDDSVDAIKKKNYKHVSVIKNDQNYGFSKANNIGIKKTSGRYVLFLNSDTVVYEHTLETMVNFMDDHPKVGASTCELLLVSGNIDDASHRGFPTPWNSFCHFFKLAKVFPHTKLFTGYSMGWKDLKTIHEIDALAGAFMLVRREAGEQVKWWDEDYFWYGEDLDFCYELKQHGWKIYYVPTVKTLHFKGASGGIKKESESITQASNETKLRATRARFTAMRIFYKKHYAGKYPGIITWAVDKGITYLEKRAVKRYS